MPALPAEASMRGRSRRYELRQVPGPVSINMSPVPCCGRGSTAQCLARLSSPCTQMTAHRVVRPPAFPGLCQTPTGYVGKRLSWVGLQPHEAAYNMAAWHIRNASPPTILDHKQYPQLFLNVGRLCVAQNNLFAANLAPCMAPRRSDRQQALLGPKEPSC